MTAPCSPLLANLLRFPRLLAAAGLPVSLDQTLCFLTALDQIDIRQRRQVFHTARATLVTAHGHLRLFETLFHRFWRQQHGAPPPRGRSQRPDAAKRRSRPLTVVDLMSYRTRHAETSVETVDRAATYSPQELLRHKDFAALEPEELAAVRRQIQRLRFAVARRRSQRRKSDPKGRELDLRGVLRHTGRLGIPLELPRRRRKIEQRPVILLADISGSMEPYSRLLLHLFYSALHSLERVECFVFGTRLSRITPQLRLRHVDRAVDEAARQVLDWAGGTRIGESLKTFNRQWGRRLLRRGAVVVVVSDGWERGDVSILGHETGALARRCHRLIWLNPLSGHPGYRPRVEGMAAAMPHIDDFLPAGNLHSLEQLVDHLETLPTRRGARGARLSGKMRNGETAL